VPVAGGGLPLFTELPRETVRRPAEAPIWSLKSPRNRPKKLYFAALEAKRGGSRGCSRLFLDSLRGLVPENSVAKRAKPQLPQGLLYPSFLQ